MYYFEKLNLNYLGENQAVAGNFEHAEVGLGDFSSYANLLEIIKIGARFRRHLFDDYSFSYGEKSKLEADFECAMRIIEVAFEAAGSGDFYVVCADNGKTREIAGFWYIYDVNYRRARGGVNGNFGFKEVKTPVVGALAGCLKKKYWGAPARVIMNQVLEEVFIKREFRKIKCETFSTNPYIERFLGEFKFRLEGVLKNEVEAAGKLADVKIWGLEREVE